MNYMGEENFDRAMQFYFENFKFKHPQPRDLRKTLEFYSGKDLSWFFDDLIRTTKKLDYKIVKAKKDKEGVYQITIKNVGEVKGPVAICGLYKGEIRAMMWLDGFDGKQTVGYPPAEVDEFRIDHFQFMPDINRTNNRSRAKGIFKRVEPIKLPFIAALDDPYQNQLNWAPAFGYNNYNGFMAGLALYNHTAFQKRIEYEIAPLYDFKNKTIAGYANVRANLMFKKIFRQVTIGVQSARFAYNDEHLVTNYNKIAPYINFEFKKKNLRSPITQNVIYRSILIGKEIETWPKYTFAEVTRPLIQIQNTLIHSLSYKLKNDRTIDPFNITVNAQLIDEMSKASVTANYFVSLPKNKKVHFRLFAGKMFHNSTTGDYRFRMSGQTGYQDYTYDNVYFGRSATLPNIGAQQFTETDGAFKVYTPLGQSDDWIVALNIKTPKIFKIPAFIYSDIGIYNAKGLDAPEMLYSLGVGVPLIKDIIEIYFPVLNSKNITDVQKLNNSNRYLDQIRFTFYLNRANPFEVIKNNLPF
jgi:hypothetical protein